MSGDILVQTDGVSSLGSATKAWAVVYADTIAVSSLAVTTLNVTALNASQSVSTAYIYASSNIHVNDILDTSGNVVFSNQDFNPKFGGAYDLGTSTLFWQQVFMDDLDVDKFIAKDDNQIKIADDLDPVLTESSALGESGLVYQIIWTVFSAASTIMSGDGTLHIKVGDDLDPTYHGQIDLGDSTLYWQLGYIDDIFCDTISTRSGTGVNFLNDIDIGDNHFTFAEMTAPGSAGTNTARIYAEVNGSSKTELKVIFQSGAAIIIATEP